MKSMIRRSFFAAALLWIVPAVGQAEITKTLTVNVWQVCDNDGLNCAKTGPIAGNSAGDTYYALATNKIWAQAGIGVFFNFVGTINNTSWLTIDPLNNWAEADALTSSGAYYKSWTQTEMFLVDRIVGLSGIGNEGGGGIILGMDDVLGLHQYPEALDVVAHEIGHNLDVFRYPGDLNDDAWGHSRNPYQLMARGGIRYVPTSRSDIAPDGLGFDQLSDFQIARARESWLLRDVTTVPEPSSVVLFAAGALAIGVIRRRRSTVTAN
jgi:hypothetical protein